MRVAAAFDPRVRVLATGRATRPAVTYATLEQFVAAQAAHITPHRRWYNRWSNAFGFHDEEFVEPKPAGGAGCSSWAIRSRSRRFPIPRVW